MNKSTLALLLVSAFAGSFIGTSLPTWLGETTTPHKYVAKILCATDCYLRTRIAPTGIYLSGGVTMYFKVARGDKLAFSRTHKDTDNFVEFTVLDNAWLAK